MQVYKARLGPKDTARMIETEGGERKLRERAECYDPMTIVYFSAFGMDVPRLQQTPLGAEATSG